MSFRFDLVHTAPRGTLHDWFDHWLREPIRRPYDRYLHGARSCIFTDDEEAQIADDIRSTCLTYGFVFAKSDFHHLAMKAYVSKSDEQACERQAILSK
jgi:hypothetical protein